MDLLSLDDVMVSAQNGSMTAMTHQQYLTDPCRHLWVSASAGTGKTKALTDRLLGLLVQGVSSQKILCLTFTKTAATEMSHRLQSRLAAWSRLTQGQLNLAVSELLGRAPTSSEMLITEGLCHAPVSLNITTIHGYCSVLLKQFPVEAGVSLHATLMEPHQEQQLIQDALRYSGLNPEFEGLLRSLAPLYDLNSLQDLFFELNALRSERGERRETLWSSERVEKDLKEVEGHLAVPPFQPLGVLLCPFIDALNEEEKCQDFVFALHHQLQQPDVLHPLYKTCFLTQAGTLRQRLLPQAILKRNHSLEERLAEEAQRILGHQTSQKHQEILKANQALWPLCQSFMERYRSLKRESHLLDYTDLLELVYGLLSDDRVADWVFYKLGGRLSHLLVDEAQDTNPLQWKIIALLCDDFFGEEERSKSLFVVGDIKQAIYGFQGARAQDFLNFRQYFRHRALSASPEGEALWKDLYLSASYRSTPPVLGVVDRLFEDPVLKGGVVFPEDPSLQHQTARSECAGEVVVLHPTPIDSDAEDSLERRHAQRLLSDIQKRIASGLWLSRHQRYAVPGDVMILVQQRGSLFDALISEAQKLGLPITEHDRLSLKDHLFIQDLISLARMLTCPEDHLSLAQVLRSPLFGLTEEDLFLLRYSVVEGDNPGSLWKSLLIQKESYPRVVEKLERWRLEAQGRASSFFRGLLFDQGELRSFEKAFGSVIYPLITSFLNLVSAFEVQQPMGLLHFLNWFDQLDTIVLQKSSSAAQAIQLQTIHGSKGRQAPVVILADTTRPFVTETSFYKKGECCFWVPRSHYWTSQLEGAQAQQAQLLKQESHRLLYVAVTRAEEVLIFAGAENRQMGKSWFERIAAIFSAEEADPSLSEAGILWRHHVSEEKSPLLQSSVVIRQEETPSWFFNPVSPFSIETSGGLSGSTSIRRGVQLHELLQEVLKTPANKRASYLAWKQRQGGEMHLLQEVQALLEAPDLAPLWGADKILSEVDVGARQQSGGFSILGTQAHLSRIDLVCVFAERVVLLDLKTGARIVPIPFEYEGQLNRYAYHVAKLFPKHRVQRGILWSQEATVDWLSDEDKEQ